ncbi:putative disease resistance protein RGA3 [Lolium perenne]|uniref:putative disease resistance protein RGA3 n=1 Tax=Lolium perenne TaxID=4522 RepID=UPI003A98F873
MATSIEHQQGESPPAEASKQHGATSSTSSQQHQQQAAPAASGTNSQQHQQLAAPAAPSQQQAAPEASSTSSSKQFSKQQMHAASSSNGGLLTGKKMAALEQITNMNMLQETLSRVLRGKRYLLVLDDVWNEDCDKWLSYRAALISGGLGSNIVVIAAHIHSWSIFKSHAFRDGDCSTYPQLELIGRKIVKKLKGLPLASKALGSLLFCKADEADWKDILRNDIWELPAEKNNILSALRLSYNHLPLHLKQCFAFCSVYPKCHNLF